VLPSIGLKMLGSKNTVVHYGGICELQRKGNVNMMQGDSVSFLRININSIFVINDRFYISCRGKCDFEAFTTKPDFIN